MKALGFTMSEAVHKAILAEAAKLKTSASTLIRKTVCQALDIHDDTVVKRACLIGLTYEQKLERKPVSEATTPEAAHFRQVSLGSSRHCIDCTHCTTTGKCARFGIRLNGPHVCDCFQEGG